MDHHAARLKRRDVRLDGLVAERVALKPDHVALAQPLVGHQRADVLDAVVGQAHIGQVCKAGQFRDVGNPLAVEMQARQVGGGGDAGQVPDGRVGNVPPPQERLGARSQSRQGQDVVGCDDIAGGHA